MKVTKKDLLLLGIVFLVLLAADQITKAVAFAVMGENAPVTMVIPGFLGFNTVLNEGISFSIGEDGEWTQPIVIAITAVASIVIAVLICKIPKRRLLLRYALVLILAGAVGNLIDRIAMQAVRDFIYMNFGFVDFSNNVADLEITVGAVMLIICLLFVDEEAVFRPAPKESPAQEMKGEEPPAGGLKEEELPAEGGEVYGQGEAAEPAPQTGEGEQGETAESAPQTGEGETAAGIKTQPAENASSETEEEPTENASSQTEEKFAEDVSSETEEEHASAEAASSGEGADGACGKEAASSAADTKEGKGEPEAPQAGHGNA